MGVRLPGGKQTPVQLRRRRQRAWASMPGTWANSGGKTHPVGQKQPNAFGLYDMHGNVWEWCWDGYDANYYGQSPADDPQGRPQAAFRVRRGGCWDVGPRRCRSALRRWSKRALRYLNMGFRVALGQSGRSSSSGQAESGCGGSAGDAAEPRGGAKPDAAGATRRSG